MRPEQIRAITYVVQALAAVLMLVAIALMVISGQTGRQMLGIANLGVFIVNVAIFGVMFSIRSKLASLGK